jgi:hypothetical protein
MARYLAIGMLLLIFATASSPQMARTVAIDQCRADQVRWATELQALGGSEKEPFDVLVAALGQMTHCYSLDAETRDSPVNGYLFTNNFIVRVLSERQSRFLVRHGLVQQFEAEDAAGAR